MTEIDKADPEGAAWTLAQKLVADLKAVPVDEQVGYLKGSLRSIEHAVTRAMVEGFIDVLVQQRQDFSTRMADVDKRSSNDPTVRAAWIAFWAVIVSAIIVGAFQMAANRKSDSATSDSTRVMTAAPVTPSRVDSVTRAKVRTDSATSAAPTNGVVDSIPSTGRKPTPVP